MSIHFKMKNGKRNSWKSFPISSYSTSVIEIKRRIIEMTSLNKQTKSPFDLVLSNMETGEEFSNDQSQITKHTKLIVKRIPSNHSILDKIVLQISPNLSNREEELLHVISHNEMKRMSSTNSCDRPRPTTSGIVPPDGYVCHRCGKGGHYINHCNSQTVIRKFNNSVGIPRSHLKVVTNDVKMELSVIEKDSETREHPGGMLRLSNGQIAHHVPNSQDFIQYTTTPLYCSYCKSRLHNPSLKKCQECCTSFCQSCVCQCNNDTAREQHAPNKKRRRNFY